MRVNDFVFETHNKDLSIDDETLILLTNGDGDYLFKCTLSGDIRFNECNIDNNDINESIIYITEMTNTKLELSKVRIQSLK